MEGTIEVVPVGKGQHIAQLLVELAVVINDFVLAFYSVIPTQEPAEIIVADKVPQVALDNGVVESGYYVEEFKNQWLHKRTGYTTL